MDLWLVGGLSGWDVLQQLQQDPATRSIPVILLSAAVDQLREKEAWLAAHGIPAIEKPFDIEELSATIQAGIEDRLPDQPEQETAADSA